MFETFFGVSWFLGSSWETITASSSISNTKSGVSWVSESHSLTAIIVSICIKNDIVSWTSLDIATSCLPINVDGWESRQAFAAFFIDIFGGRSTSGSGCSDGHSSASGHWFTIFNWSFSAYSSSLEPTFSFITISCIFVENIIFLALIGGTKGGISAGRVFVDDQTFVIYWSIKELTTIIGT